MSNTMLTIIISNSIAIYKITLAELLDLLVKEEAISDTQEERDFAIIEYVMESYFAVAEAGGMDELLATMKKVPLDELSKDPEPSTGGELSTKQIEELRLGIKNLREQAEELLPGVNRITRVLGEKMGRSQNELLSIALGKDKITAEEAALLMEPIGEA